MDAEIICDICHKKFTNKFSLNRHVKTIHEKKEDFACMKCQKNFNEMHHLKRHPQKCRKCRRCGAQLDSLIDFAKHSCKRKQAENQKIPTKKARKSNRKPNYTGGIRAKNRKEFEVLENECLDEEDLELREFLSKYWFSIRTFSKHGKVQSLHNFYFRNFERMIDTIAERIMRDQQTRFKLIYSFGYVLRNIDTDELRYYHPSSNNTQVLDTAVTISNSNELEEFLRKIAAEDFLENFNRPDTKWKFLQITNLVFYLNHLADAPLSGPVEFPDFLTHNRGVVNHTANDNLCFFRCLFTFRGTDKRQCEQDAKQLFTAYCKHFYIDPNQFQGVLLIDFPEIEDFFEINILVYGLQDKKAKLIQRSCELYGETMQLNVFKNHLSLIVDFKKYCDVYQYQRCDKL